MLVLRERPNRSSVSGRPGRRLLGRPGFFDDAPEFLDPLGSLQAAGVRRRRDPTPNTICWRCYAKGSHYAYGCNVDLKANRRVIVANFESVTGKGKCRVAAGSYLYLKGWYHKALTEVDGPWVNPFADTKTSVRICEPEDESMEKNQKEASAVMAIVCEQPVDFSFTGKLVGPGEVAAAEKTKSSEVAEIRPLIMQLKPTDRERLRTACCFLGKREKYKVLGGLGTSKSRMHRRPMLIETGAGTN